MGLVVGKWQFENRDGVPSTEALAAALAAATKLQVTHNLEGGARHERIDIPLLGESLFDIERAEGDMTLYGYVPAHPYLWENLDRVLVALGGQRRSDATCWRPDDRFRHVRRSWDELSGSQRWLLRLPTIGPSRLLDRFV